MSEAANELSLIRKYLLGRLEGEEREQLEERVLSDAEFRNKVLMVEEDLIEDHAEGALDEVERQKFRQMFYANPQRRIEVQVVEGLKQHAATNWWTRLFTNIWRPRDAATVSGNWLDSLWDFRKAAIAFTLVVAVIVALLIVYRSLRPEQMPGSLTQEQQRRDLIERELARLNDPASRESQQHVAMVATLSPGLSRGDEPPPIVEFPTIALARGTELAQLTLQLKPSAQAYPSFQAALIRVGASESYRVDLRPVALSGVSTLVLTLPLRALDDGDYRVQLSGYTAGGQTEMLPDHYYYFRLVRR
jgi:anti-sigma-K factor RskA